MAVPAENNTLKSRRRWFQFSLRTLLLVVVLLALPLSWLGARLRYKQTERRGAAKLNEPGCFVLYGSVLSGDQKPPGPAWLRALLGDDFFTDVEGVTLADVTKEQLAVLAELRSLKYLDLCYTTVSDAELDDLARLSRLRVLSLGGTRVTEQGVRRLRQALPGCKIYTREDSSGFCTIDSIAVSPTRENVAFALGRSLNVPPLREHMESLGAGNAVEILFGRSDVRLWVLDLATGEAYDTRAETNISEDPAWAPDGSHIVIVSGRFMPQGASFSDGPFLGLDQVDLGNADVVAIAKPTCSSPRYSPDGRYLAYVQRNGRSDLVIRDLRSGTEQIVQGRDRGVGDWCWSADGSKVYVQDAGCLYEMSLFDREERVLFSAGDGEDWPSRPVCSPHGRQLGLSLDGPSFYTLDLATRAVKYRFESCSCVDWNESGICYLRYMEGEEEGNVQLTICDPSEDTATAVAMGPFRDPRWVDESHILVRRGDAELWLYDVHTKKGRRVFPTK